MERVWFIKDVSICDRLADSEIRPLEYHSRARAFATGTPIGLPDDTAVFLVTEGRVHVEVAYRGDQSPVAVRLAPGDLLGIVPGFASLLHERAVTAVSNATLVAIPHSLFHRLLDRHPDYTIVVTKWVGWSPRRLKSWFNDLVFRTARQRVARLFLSLVAAQEHQPAHAVGLPLPLTVSDVTRLTASDAAVVQFVLEELVDEDLLRWEGTRMELLDPRRLAHSYLRSPAVPNEPTQAPRRRSLQVRP